jgi:predicted transposase YbfD/YdcC
MEAFMAADEAALAPPDELRVAALDGKNVCGAGRHGQPTFLLSLATHRTSTVLGQVEVAEKSNEIPFAPPLIHQTAAGWDLLTGDALHCQRDTMLTCLAEGRDYLLQVKDNQPTLLADLAYFFDSPRTGRHAPRIEAIETDDKGHGRREHRRCEVSSELSDYLQTEHGWPSPRQVVRRICERWRDGHYSRQVHYYITSLSAERADPPRLEAWCRGHWSIENRLHRVRDVTFGEDASDIRSGSAPQAMAALRNLVIHLTRREGWPLLTPAQRYYCAKLDEALALLGCARL